MVKELERMERPVDPKNVEVVSLRGLGPDRLRGPHAGRFFRPEIMRMDRMCRHEAA